MGQLLMRLKSLDNIPDTPLPDGLSVETAGENAAREWEWIVNGAFQEKYSFDMMTGDAECEYRPERVLFARCFGQSAATASAYRRNEYPGEGYLHMVATHPWYQGQGAGRAVVLEALRQFRREGLHSVVLSTDDFRLNAVALYKSVGFEPIVQDGDQEMKARWEKVDEALKAMKPKPQPIPLWSEGAPGFVSEYGQKQPSLKPFPVSGARGAVVVCPGGGYGMKAAHEGAPVARMINEAGIAAYVLDYRVAPYHAPVPLWDVQRAIRLVRSMGYEQVGVLGFSAGGHLTCSAATLYDGGNPEAQDPIERLSSRPDVFIPCYAVVSMAAFSHQGSVENLLGNEKDNYQALRRYSAELNVTRDTPPAYIWHTRDDAGVPVENSLRLAQALATAGVEFELHVFPHGAHGMGLAGMDPVVGQWPGMLQKWLLNHGFGAKVVEQP